MEREHSQISPLTSQPPGSNLAGWIFLHGPATHLLDNQEEVNEIGPAKGRSEDEE